VELIEPRVLIENRTQIAEIARDVRSDFRSLNSSEARILLVESGERLLSAFPPSLSAKALRSLERDGVSTRLGHTVIDLDCRSVTLRDPNDASERIPARTVIWPPAWSRRASAVCSPSVPGSRWIGRVRPPDPSLPLPRQGQPRHDRARERRR
jgi:NADH:ubiquinone reductase (H+-translocating)